jgi:hypothetical protein
MRFIDSHTHPCFGSSLFIDVAKSNKIKFDIDSYFKDLQENGVEKAVAIGIDRASNLKVKEIGEKFDNIIPIAGITKTQLKEDVAFAEKEIKKGCFKGLKLFLGYDDFFADDKTLEPVYRLAERNDVPVIFHTGDPWKPVRAKPRIKYSHPLPIDNVAVDHPNMRILIAHAGNPWIDDVAEIIYKNDNCYADVSGWFLGDVEEFYRDLMKRKLKDLLAFAGDDKVLFGSDWPLERLDFYTEFLKETLTSTTLNKVAYDNAKIFWRL